MVHVPWDQQDHSWEPLREQERSLQESFPIFQGQENPHQNPPLEDCDECKTVVKVGALPEEVGMNPKEDQHLRFHRMFCIGRDPQGLLSPAPL